MGCLGRTLGWGILLVVGGGLLLLSWPLALALFLIVLLFWGMKLAFQGNGRGKYNAYWQEPDQEEEDHIHWTERLF